MCHGSMHRREILNSPLPFLYAASAAVFENAALLSGIPLGKRGGETAGEKDSGQGMSGEAFAAEINAAFGNM